MTEVSCEGTAKGCNPDMRFFKGITIRALASVAYLAPQQRETLAEGGLRDSAAAAVKTCEGGERGRECGFVWADGEERGEKMVGAPEEMNVLSALVGMLGGEVAGRELVTSGEGGEDGEEGSGGDGNGGNGGDEAEGGNGGGDGGSAGASTRVGMGLVLAGVFAAALL